MEEGASFHAMVLAAGFGTRLAPLTDEIPKPLVPILGRPLLGRTLQKLERAGARRLVVNAHHMSDEIVKYIEGLSFTVQVSLEAEILGTAGGVAKARPWLTGAPVLVVNGDILGELPIDALVRERGEGLTLAGTPAAPGRGTVGLDLQGRVVRLRGEIFGEETTSIDYMGLARLGHICLSRLPDRGCLIGDFALPHLRAGGEVRGVAVACRFEDIGSPKAYLNAHLRRIPRGTSQVEQSATVGAEVTIVSSYVGHGARIEGSGTIENCVVLAGARVHAPLSGAIVTPSGAVMKVQ